MINKNKYKFKIVKKCHSKIVAGLALIAKHRLCPRPCSCPPTTIPIAVNRIYVANYSDNNVSVIDGSTNTVIATVPVGFTPLSIGVNPLTNGVYVANGTDDNVSVICGISNTCQLPTNHNAVDHALYS